MRNSDATFTNNKISHPHKLHYKNIFIYAEKALPPSTDDDALEQFNLTALPGGSVGQWMQMTLIKSPQ